MVRRMRPRDMIDRRMSSFDYTKKTKTIKKSEIVDKMLENIMKDIEEGKIKKEDIKNMANIIAEKKLKALTPEKFEKYEKQERFLRDLYDDIPPKEQDKKFFVNTFEKYWKIYQEQYVKKGLVPTDYSLFPRDISEAIKRGQITTKDVEIVITPSGIEYRSKKPISLPVPEEKPSGIQIRVFGEEKSEEKTEEKPKEEKPKEEDEDRHVAFKIGKNKFYVKGFNEYIVKVRKLDEDKWIAEAEELYGSVFPYEGAEYEKAKGRTLEQALDNISDRIDFRGEFPLEGEEKPEILEQRISEIKNMKKSKPSITTKTFVSQTKKEELPKGIEVKTFVPQTMKEKETPKPVVQIKTEEKETEEKETRPGIQIRIFGSEEKEKIDDKAKKAAVDMVKQAEEKVEEMVSKSKPKPEGKRERKLRAKEEEVVDKIIEEWSESKELRPLVEDFLMRNLPKLVEKKPDVAKEILKNELKKEEPETEFLRAYRILTEKKPEASFELLKEWQKVKIQEARNEIRNKIDLDVKRTRQGFEVEGIVPERSVFLTEGKQAIVMPTYLYLDLEEKKLKMQQEMLERKRKEQEEKLKKMEEEKRKREEAQRAELEELYRSKGIRPSMINEAETLAEPVKMVMETPKTAEIPSVSQREIPTPNFIERFASGVKPVVERTRPAVKSFVSGVEKGMKSFMGIKPTEVARTETVSAIEDVKGIPYQIETEYAEKGGFMRIKETRKNLLTGSVKVEEKLLPKSPVETIKQSIPARFIKAVVPIGTPQVRRWLHSQAGSVRPISRELDWRKVEMRRLRLASRR